MSKSGSNVKTLRILLVSLLALGVAFGFLLNYAYGSSPSSAPELSLDKVYDLASRGKISVAELLDEDAVVGTVCTSQSVEAAAAAAAADVSQSGAPAMTDARGAPPITVRTSVMSRIVPSLNAIWSTF